MKKRQGSKKYLFILLLCGISVMSYAQTPTDSLPGDPGALAVFNVQNMSFGAFSHGGSGGTIAIAPAGTRSVTGTVTALNLGVSYYQAIFDIEAPNGAIISITNGPNATLTGSNGGTMSLQLGSSSPGSPFINTIPAPGRTQVNIGGTLTVGNSTANPPGTYSGTFYIIFNQE